MTAAVVAAAFPPPQEFLHRAKHIVDILTRDYHDRDKVHGRLSPTTVHMLGNQPISIDPPCYQTEQPIPFRAPDLLAPPPSSSPPTDHHHHHYNEASTKYHDYYALFTTVLYLPHCKIFNTPLAPILNPLALERKITIFMQRDVLEKKDLPEGIQTVILYFHKLYMGEIIYTSPKQL